MLNRVIRKATVTDYKSLVSSINRGAKVDFITAKQLKYDLLNDELYVLQDNKKIVAIFSIVYDVSYQALYIKRLKVLNKNNYGKGYAAEVIKYVSELPYKVSVTPWENNHAIIKVLKRFNFQLVKTFNEIWCLYESEGILKC